jgi:hypothetical protein
MIPAYSPQTRSRSECNFGSWRGLSAPGVTAAWNRQRGEANRFVREPYIAELNRRFQAPAAERGTAFLPRRSQNLLIFSLQFEQAVNRDNTVSFQHLQLRRGALAGDLGGLHGAGASASGRNSHGYAGTSATVPIQRGRKVTAAQNAASRVVEKM